MESRKYELRIYAHLPIDDRHNQQVIRAIKFEVPLDEVLGKIEIAREKDGSLETVASFEAVDPARHYGPFMPLTKSRQFTPHTCSVCGFTHSGPSSVRQW